MKNLEDRDYCLIKMSSVAHAAASSLDCVWDLSCLLSFEGKIELLTKFQTISDQLMELSKETYGLSQYNKGNS